VIGIGICIGIITDLIIGFDICNWKWETVNGKLALGIGEWGMGNGER
jgi:hypothetical protein